MSIRIFFAPSYFYPRPPRGGRQASKAKIAQAEAISIHALREEGDHVQSLPPLCRGNISIHALREEGDARAETAATPFCNFYPRPPRGGRLSTGRILPPRRLFLSTPSARRATGGRVYAWRGESDNFYPRPPRGGRLIGAVKVIIFAVFLSTPSARRATRMLGVQRRTTSDFYPRPPRGGRPDRRYHRSVRYWISIHALREEGDSSPGSTSASLAIFLSTPSARRATRPSKARAEAIRISIHALREEGDGPVQGSLDPAKISIHALREEGDHSGRNACESGEYISIHALREEGDGAACLPCGAGCKISIHALREEGDL